MRFSYPESCAKRDSGEYRRNLPLWTFSVNIRQQISRRALDLRNSLFQLALDFLARCPAVVEHFEHLPMRHPARIRHQALRSDRFHYAQEFVAISDGNRGNPLRYGGNAGVHAGAEEKPAETDDITHLARAIRAAQNADAARVTTAQTVVKLLAGQYVAFYPALGFKHVRDKQDLRLCAFQQRANQDMHEAAIVRAQSELVFSRVPSLKQQTADVHSDQSRIPATWCGQSLDAELRRRNRLDCKTHVVSKSAISPSWMRGRNIHQLRQAAAVSTPALLGALYNPARYEPSRSPAERAIRLRQQDEPLAEEKKQNLRQRRIEKARQAINVAEAVSS